MDKINSGVIYTNDARCMDCYRCVRGCPVNAIKMSNGQASVVDERCILCGTCIKNCPQNAKSYRKDSYLIESFVEEGVPVAATVAPSFISLFSGWERKRIPSLLRKLGFSYVAHTSNAAWYTGKKTAEYFRDGNKSVIAGACPAAVNYVLKYAPEFSGNIAPVLSPMAAHGRMMKEKLGQEWKVVFIGPCPAKKGELRFDEVSENIDAVITFEELINWAENRNISLSSLEESSFDEEPVENSALFPAPGGLIRTAEEITSEFSESCIAVDGFDNIDDAIHSINGEGKLFIEPLMCRGGCINGPAAKFYSTILSRKIDLENHIRNSCSEAPEEKRSRMPLDIKYDDKPVYEKQFSEEAIREVLEHTGKAGEEDYLDCGACGYSSCHEKAAAVLAGMAEMEMCIPYMRKKAEKRTDKIIESSPNGIVIINDQLEILHMNPAFKRFFMCGNSITGKRISYLMDPEPFIKLKDGREEKTELTQRHENYNITCHEILYKLVEDRQYVGIFVDITRSQDDSKKLDEIRRETIRQAGELMEHQVEMAQNMAKLLGESTAKGEALVENLMKLSGNKKEKNEKMKWLRDTYTSK